MAIGLSGRSRVIGGALLLVGVAPVLAQEQASTTAAATPEAGGLAEIVVTAERRAENIQNVPIAVTAFTADALQSRNLTNVQTLGALSPGVNLDAAAPF